MNFAFLASQSTKARIAQSYQACSGFVSTALQPGESPTEGALPVLSYVYEYGSSIHYTIQMLKSSKVLQCKPERMC